MACHYKNHHDHSMSTFVCGASLITAFDQQALTRRSAQTLKKEERKADSSLWQEYFGCDICLIATVVVVTTMVFVVVAQGILLRDEGSMQ